MDSFKDFLSEISPTIEEEVENSIKSYKLSNDLETTAYMATATTIVFLRKYHEWLTRQLS